MKNKFILLLFLLFTSKILAQTITSFLPLSGTTGSAIFIKGSGFTNASAVTIGGANISVYSVLDDNTIYAVVPSTSSGSVTVTNAAQTNTATLAGFTYSAGVTPTATAPSVGDGTSGNPYQIANLQNLYWLTTNTSAWSKYFIQTANIDASESSTWTGGEGFIPIGNTATYFTGHYDGQGFSINNLFINKTSSNTYIALFGRTNAATISNLTISNARFVALTTGYNGGFMGQANSSTITNCVANDGIIYNGPGYVGGFIGNISTGATVTNCSANVNTYSLTQYTGGFVGLMDASTATVTRSFCLGKVTGTGYLGGFIGFPMAGVITDCYSRSNVVSTGNLNGGFVSFNSSGTVAMTNCYATGTVTGTNYLGGFSGYTSGQTYSHCFWNTTTSGKTFGLGNTGTNANVTGITSTEMQTTATFTAAGWDFAGETTNGNNDYWTINSSNNDGFPYLTWQYFPAAPTVTSFTPSTGTVGTSVTITGTSFSGITGITVGGVAVTSYTVNTLTGITFTVPVGAISGNIVVTNSIGTGTSSAPFLVSNTWIGTTSASWNTASNWSLNAVPTSSDNIVINSNGTNAPLMDVDVTIPVGKSLTISGTGTLTIAPGKVLTIAGTADFGAKLVTFKSDATGTAMFGPLTGTLTGATNVKVERFIPQGKRAFRLLSPAVTTTTFISGNWQQGTHITGGATGGFDVTETNNPSMYTYNNQVASGTGWTAIANTNATNLTAGVGYRVLVRGDRTPTNITSASADAMNAVTTLTATGTLKTGAVILNSSSTPAINNTSNTTTADYSLVGNPYQSAIDWNAVTKSGIDATYYAWDPNMGTSSQRGRYVAYNGTTNDNVNSQVGQYIQPGQAFFVKNTVSGTAGTLTFQEAHKATTSASVFRMANQTPSVLDSSVSIQLYDPSELAIGGYPIDAMKAVFNAEYQNTLGTGDATKLESAGENIAWFRNNTKLAIDAAAPLSSTDELLVKTLRLGANKNYTFKIQTANFDANLTLYLVDNFLNTQTEISTSQAFLASFATTTNAASYNEDRFKIVFTTSALHNDTFTTQIGLYPNPSKGNVFNLQLPSSAEVSVKLFNTLGQEIGLTNNGNTYQAVQSLPTGMYYIKVTQGAQTSKLKWIVE